LTVLDNVRLPLRMNRKANGKRTLGDPVALLQSLGLGGAIKKRPAQLSGGMQQRVSIARAFHFDPSVLLMDEPFSALDEFTREMIRGELLRMWEQDKKTVLFVTHSVAEAVALSDIVIVMSASPGRIRAAVPITLPRPRPEGIETTPEFHELEDRIRMELKGGWNRGS
jgi:NitT/TauT family transport system ATP-binding protein